MNDIPIEPWQWYCMGLALFGLTLGFIAFVMYVNKEEKKWRES